MLGIHISKARNMPILSSFLESFLEKFGRHLVYSDGGTWHPETCKVLGLKLLTFTIREKHDRKGQPVFQE